MKIKLRLRMFTLPPQSNSLRPFIGNSVSWALIPPLVCIQIGSHALLDRTNDLPFSIPHSVAHAIVMGFWTSSQESTGMYVWKERYSRPPLGCCGGGELQKVKRVLILIFKYWLDWVPASQLVRLVVDRSLVLASQRPTSPLSFWRAKKSSLKPISLCVSFIRQRKNHTYICPPFIATTTSFLVCLLDSSYYGILRPRTWLPAPPSLTPE